MNKTSYTMIEVRDLNVQNVVGQPQIIYVQRANLTQSDISDIVQKISQVIASRAQDG